MQTIPNYRIHPNTVEAIDQLAGLLGLSKTAIIMQLVDECDPNKLEIDEEKYRIHRSYYLDEVEREKLAKKAKQLGISQGKFIDLLVMNKMAALRASAKRSATAAEKPVKAAKKKKKE